MQLILGIFLISCGTTLSLGESQSMKVMTDFSQNYMKPQGFLLSGIGSAMPDKIHELDVDYTSSIYVNVEQARKLFIDNSQIFLNEINGDTILRPYLVEYPFTEKNIAFTLSFENERAQMYPPPYIAYVSIINSKIYYHFYLAEQEKLLNIHEETYQEALKIVRGVKLNQ